MKLFQWVVLILLSILMAHQVQGQLALFSGKKPKVLYEQLDNKIDISIPGHACEDLKLQSPNCSIAGAGCNYVANPGTSKSVVFTVRSKRTNKVIDSFSVPVKKIPKAKMRVALGNDNSGPLLKNGPIMVAQDSDSSFVADDWYKIKQFVVTITSGSKVVFQSRIKGSRYDAPTLAAIAKAKRGDKLFVEGIEVIVPDGGVRAYGDFTYTFR